MIESRVSESANQWVEFARDYLEGLKKCLDVLSLRQVEEVVGYLEDAYREEKQVFIIGNGGSAATASHMACDLGKNVLPKEARETVRRFRVMALTDNVPWMTALANDLGYEHIFSEQLRNLLQAGDLVIAISGSGNSPNIVEGVRLARALGAKVVGILWVSTAGRLGRWLIHALLWQTRTIAISRMRTSHWIICSQPI